MFESIFTLQNLPLAAILLVELAVFYIFYSRGPGLRTIYSGHQAWIIDLFAIGSGSLIMGFALWVKNHPDIWNIEVPTLLLYLLFISGSWQASIHMVKWYLRITRDDV